MSDAEMDRAQDSCDWDSDDDAADHWYTGVMKSFSDGRGFGFIECEGIKVACGQDVYVHGNVAYAAQVAVGDEVQFKVHLNPKGFPQASAPLRVLKPDAYFGRIKSYIKSPTGFGYLACEETMAEYGKDVYIPPGMGDGFFVGQEVYFEYTCQRPGLPIISGMWPALPSDTQGGNGQSSFGSFFSGDSGTCRRSSEGNRDGADAHGSRGCRSSGVSITRRPEIEETSGSGKGRNPDGEWGWESKGSRPVASGKGRRAEPSGKVFRGRVKSFVVRTGYGFVECKETFEEYGRDVYLQSHLLQGIEIDDQVCFTITHNTDGKPMAVSIWLADDEGADRVGIREIRPRTKCSRSQDGQRARQAIGDQAGPELPPLKCKQHHDRESLQDISPPQPKGGQCDEQSRDHDPRNAEFPPLKRRRREDREADRLRKEPSEKLVDSKKEAPEVQEGGEERAAKDGDAAGNLRSPGGSCPRSFLRSPSPESARRLVGSNERRRGPNEEAARDAKMGKEAAQKADAVAGEEEAADEVDWGQPEEAPVDKAADAVAVKQELPPEEKEGLAEAVAENAHSEGSSVKEELEDDDLQELCDSSPVPDRDGDPENRKQYQGTVVHFNMFAGCGFIKCEESDADVGSSVYVHRNVLAAGNATIGDTVRFSLHFNREGKPQASWPVKVVHSEGRPEYEGRMKVVRSDHGYIACEDAYEKYGRDIYVPWKMVGGYRVGQYVLFSVEEDGKGTPTAKKMGPSRIEKGAGKGGNTGDADGRWGRGWRRDEAWPARSNAW